MPIKIPDSLPANEILKAENIFVMTESRAVHQDIRPLHVLILNLMPKKIETETQLLRKLSNTPLQIEVDLLRIDDHVSKNTPKAHIDTFYQDFEHVKDKYYDGFIITGAPLGKVPFEQVSYKIHEPLIRGFDDIFWAPHSRYAAFDIDVIKERTDLTILASSPEVGVYLAVSPDSKQVYVTGHSEYDAETLNNEYIRDVKAGLNPKIPVNYFTNDDPNTTPHSTWQSHGFLLFSNWLNYYVYQNTPYNQVLNK